MRYDATCLGMTTSSAEPSSQPSCVHHPPVHFLFLFFDVHLHLQNNRSVFSRAFISIFAYLCMDERTFRELDFHEQWVVRPDSILAPEFPAVSDHVAMIL